jgi:hypothetical protein
VKFPDQKTQQWLYHDAFGQPRQFKDERNNVTHLNYWPWGPMKKVAEVITHRGKDGGGTEDQSTRFYYDLMGRPQNTYFPDNSYEYTGYECGQLKVWGTRKGQTKTLHYDARGREDYHTWANGAAPKIIRTWDDANRLTSLPRLSSGPGSFGSSKEGARIERCLRGIVAAETTDHSRRNRKVCRFAGHGRCGNYHIRLPSTRKGRLSLRQLLVTVTQASQRLWNCVERGAQGQLDPNTITVERCDAPVADSTALALQKIWLMMLSQSRPQ